MTVTLTKRQEAEIEVAEFRMLRFAVGVTRIDNIRNGYCKTPIFRVEEIFAIFANLDFARNFPPAKIISTANGISRNFPPAKFSSPRK